jgi:uncharacterized protein YfiM (DUF2279 family)
MLLCISEVSIAQSANNFLRPSDSLNRQRRNTVIISEAVAVAGTLYLLDKSWYSDYPRTGFHFINDNAQWLQMDKAGHVFATYHFSRVGSEMLQWSGESKRNRLIYGAGTGLLFMSAVEVLDGYSAEWGASWGDILANVGGTALYVSQELIWNEQRIIPKFSFHTTPYPSARPEVLGATLSEQFLKDYNGQTYWLSANINSFIKTEAIPKWLNLAVGYGAEGMITGNDALVNSVFFDEKERVRQFYLSFDVDLTKIQTRSNVLKTLFSVLHTVKIPAPTLEINSKGITKFHPVYF